MDGIEDEGRRAMNREFLDIVSTVLNISPVELKEDSTVETIPEWDSLNHWSVIGELEDHYGIEFTMDEATGFENLGDIYNKLMKKLES